MLLSIIVPVYNTEKYLKQCVDSLINQEDQCFEIILVNDASTDSSGAICNKYAANNSNISIIHHKINQGLVITRRDGIAAAKGEYLMHVDSDDYLLVDAVGTIHRTIVKYNCDMVIFDYLCGKIGVKEERVVRVRPEKSTTVFNMIEKETLYRQLLVGGYLNSLCIKVTRASVVDKEADYSKWKEVGNGEDSLQTLPIIDCAKSIVYLPVCLYYYRRDNESMSKSYGIKDFKSFQLLFERKMQYARRWQMNDYVIQKMKLKYWDKNLVILRDVKKKENSTVFMEYLKMIANDAVLLLVMKDIGNEKMSLYYKVMLRLLLAKRYRIIVLIMNFVSMI